MGKKILISYFEAFEGRPKNCSGLVAGELMIDPDLERHLDFVELPVSFAECWPVLNQKISDGNFDFVICLGEAKTSESIRLETTAVNLANARIPDNKSLQPKDIKVEPSGEDTLKATWPVQEVFSNYDGDLLVDLSEDAGTFVCNYIFYKALFHTKGSDLGVGFIHLPLCAEQGEVDGCPPPKYEAEELAETIKNLLLELV